MHDNLNQAWNAYAEEAREQRVKEYGHDSLTPEPTTEVLLNQAMRDLAADPRRLFVGQGVAYGGVATYRDLEGIPAEQRLEVPVAEEMQLGMCLGMSLQGYLPVSIFPRMDFLLRAMDQLVNHLDKLAWMSRGQYSPRVLIRTRVGSKKPLDAGPQHTQDHTEALRLMLKTIPVYWINKPEGILAAYRRAASYGGSSIVVEALGC